jgi:hypothetical protein
MDIPAGAVWDQSTKHSELQLVVEPASCLELCSLEQPHHSLQAYDGIYRGK